VFPICPVTVINCRVSYDGLQLNVPSIAISQLGFYDVLSSYGKPKKPLKKLHHCCCVWEEDSSFSGGDKGTLYPPSSPVSLFKDSGDGQILMENKHFFLIGYWMNAGTFRHGSNYSAPPG
jgi:hypothetical protein